MFKGKPLVTFTNSNPYLGHIPDCDGLYWMMISWPEGGISKEFVEIKILNDRYPEQEKLIKKYGHCHQITSVIRMHPKIDLSKIVADFSLFWDNVKERVEWIPVVPPKSKWEIAYEKQLQQ